MDREAHNSTEASIVIGDDVDSLPSAEDILRSFRKRGTMKAAKTMLFAALVIGGARALLFTQSAALAHLYGAITWGGAAVLLVAGRRLARSGRLEHGAYAILSALTLLLVEGAFVEGSASVMLTTVCLGFPILYLCAMALAPPEHLRYWTRAMPALFLTSVVGRQLVNPLAELEHAVDFAVVAGGGTLGMVIVGRLADGLLRALRRSLALSEAVRRGLERTQRQLVKHRDALESRVRRRTRDLEAKNQSLAEALASLERTQEQLVQSEKMASLGLLVAGIAHEIKNPLNFVNNFSELAIEFIDELAERRAAGSPVDVAEIEATLADVADNLTRIREHGRRADGIINAMLMHARERHGEPISVDFNAMVLEHANLAYHGFRASERGFAMDIVKDLDASIGEVMIPYQEVARVVVNLVSNACHAMRERQQSDPDYNAALTLRTGRRLGEVELVVKDNGIGMTADIRRRVFDPFYTTKPPGEGTGLGLSLSYEVIVKELGGSIDVLSMTGEGAEFVVRIPVPDEAAVVA
ncbi:MAG: hypothetical protein KC486_01005 [Myxococcales bacterium]|nr:hypothetical protein [Myxococcales bacterium]